MRLYGKRVRVIDHEVRWRWWASRSFRLTSYVSCRRGSLVGAWGDCIRARDRQRGLVFLAVIVMIMIMIMIMIIVMVKVPHLIRLIPTLPRMGVTTEQILAVMCPDFSRMQRNHEVLSTIPWLQPTTGWLAGNGPAVMAIMSTMMFPINTWVRAIMIRQTQGLVGASYVEITASLPNWIHTNFEWRPSRCTKIFSLPHHVFESHHQYYFHHPSVSSSIATALINRFIFVSTAFFPHDK